LIFYPNAVLPHLPCIRQTQSADNIVRSILKINRNYSRTEDLNKNKELLQVKIPEKVEILPVKCYNIRYENMPSGNGWSSIIKKYGVEYGLS
jgi:predicted ATP-binding protein involved in virulence